MILLVEDFLPDMHRKYLMHNFKMSGNYRSYKDFIPSYLQGRPPSVILLCLERIARSKKYSMEENKPTGLFTIDSSGKTHTVDFGLIQDGLHVPARTGLTGTYHV